MARPVRWSGGKGELDAVNTWKIVIVATLSGLFATWVASETRRVEYRDFEPGKSMVERQAFDYGLEGDFATTSTYVRGSPYVFAVSIEGLSEREAKALRLDAVSLTFAASGKSIRIANPKRFFAEDGHGSFSAGFVFPAADLPYEDCAVTMTLFD